MTDRLTPRMLRDLADLDDAWLKLACSSQPDTPNWTAFLHEEAARREAEAKELGRVDAWDAEKARADRLAAGLVALREAWKDDEVSGSKFGAMLDELIDGGDRG